MTRQKNSPLIEYHIQMAKRCCSCEIPVTSMYEDVQRPPSFVAIKDWSTLLSSKSNPDDEVTQVTREITSLRKDKEIKEISSTMERVTNTSDLYTSSEKTDVTEW